MRTLVSIGFVIALVSWSAGTVGASPPPFLLPQRAVPPAMRLSLSGMPFGQHPHAGAAAQSVHSSIPEADGRYPAAGLIVANGVLYGTTKFGGKYDRGAVFALTPAGTERVLYSFSYGTDGAYPQAGLVYVNGVLYGTTGGGGGGQFLGTVFAVTTTGQERVLHTFTGGADGSYPTAGLIDVNGVLYGTTQYGGVYLGYGTVFAVTASGKERVLYDFGSGYTTDGAGPSAGLVNVNGVLYGTTAGGGYGTGGTVFAVTTTGQERVLYNFGSGANRADGNTPQAGLIDVNGVLYGTTYNGGRYVPPHNFFGGTVFEVTRTGQERVLHSFGSGADGSSPTAGLIDVNCVLYGTTYYGGKYNLGTVFAVTRTGQERVLYAFTGADGAFPIGNLVNVNGVLYGTTSYGGQYNDGTVFEVTRTGQVRVLHSFVGCNGGCVR